MLRIVEEEAEEKSSELACTLDELAREGARRMLMQALEEEVAAYLAAHAEERDERGHRRVVRNGKARARQVTMGCGTVEVRAPRVDDRRTDASGARQRFTSAILPPYMRRSPKVAEVLPVLYLRGLSTGDFRPALESLLGAEASGLSATSISRMLGLWEEEHRSFRRRSLAERDYVYVWVDGIHLGVRLGEDRKLCLLVMIGARPDGTKELVAIEDGYRESTESWAALLRDLLARGMQAPVLAVGDGALGFWAAMRDVWPETAAQRDWFHKLGNVLDKLPKRLQRQAKEALDQIVGAESRKHAEEAIAGFEHAYGAKYPKAVECLRRDQEALLTFFDFPAEHWIHLRTSNAIESAFSTVRLRQRTTKGPGSRTRGLAMVFKLLEMAQMRWRRLNAGHLLPLVRAGARFQDGKLVERTDTAEERRDAA